MHVARRSLYTVSGYKLDCMTRVVTVVTLDWDFGEFFELMDDWPGFDDVVGQLLGHYTGKHVLIICQYLKQLRLLSKRFGIAVKIFKLILRIGVLQFILWLTGDQAFFEVTPKAIQAVVAHFENATEIGGLAAVEKHVACRRVGIVIATSLEHPELDRAQKGLRTPKPETELHDGVG